MEHLYSRVAVRTTLASALLMAFNSAQAFDFENEAGWQGSFNNTVSVGSSWRMQAPSNKLYALGDGLRVGETDGRGGSLNSNGNLNWDKGDRFSTPFKLISELSMKKNDAGMFIRTKAWHDDALENRSVRAGNADQRFRTNHKLSDKSQPDLNKFSGFALMDAYIYNTWDVGGAPLQLRAGRQVINWGESLFIQGINQVNPLDLPALRKPGTEVKEVMLPVWSLYGNLGLGGGKSLEAFYQFRWEGHNIDQCGMYWGPLEWSMDTNPGSGCRSGIVAVPNPGAGVLSNGVAQQTGFYVPLGKGSDGKNSGQFGLAFRMPIDAIDSEVGLYATRINARAPIASVRSGTWGRTPPQLIRRQNNPLMVQQNAFGRFGAVAGQGFWEYPDAIDIFGTSLSTNIAGWSVGSELSFTKDMPVQINGNDLLAGMLNGVGPVGEMSRTAAAKGLGTVLHGYDRMDKTQFQVNTVKVLPPTLGASQGLFIAEVGAQWLDMPNNGLRYGRPFIFGVGSHPAYGGSTCASNAQPDGCKDAGYVTDFSWGYRLRFSLDYPGLIGGFTVSPSVFFGHDVEGYSADAQFVEDRKALAFGVKFDYQKRYAMEFNYTTFSDSAKYDMFRDRDYASAVLSASF